MVLLEARHAEFGDALRSDEELVVDGEPFNPRLHLAMHQVVASQLLADDPPETWQTVQRLAALGYDWDKIMHMIARLPCDDLYNALNERREFDAADYVRRLAATAAAGTVLTRNAAVPSRAVTIDRDR